VSDVLNIETNQILKTIGYTGSKPAQELSYVSVSSVIGPDTDATICVHAGPNDRRTCQRCFEALYAVYEYVFTNLLKEFVETSIVNGYVDNPRIKRVNDTDTTKKLKTVYAECVWLKIQNESIYAYVRTAPNGPVVQYDLSSGIGNGMVPAMLNDVTRYRDLCARNGTYPLLVNTHRVPDLLELRDCN